MLARLARVILSFAVVMSSYWLYAAIAVPLIEPPPPVIIGEDDDELVKKVPVVDAMRQRLAKWFHPDDWEMKSPKILETPQGILLVDNYRVQAEGRVELWPCTMIFLPSGKNESSDDLDRRAIIMRSSPDRGKAILNFEGEFDLVHGKIGKLNGGQLVGNVTIYSQQRSPGPEDDLQIHARDIELRGDRVTSPHLVDLRCGKNTPRGNRLKIELSPDDRSVGFRGLLAVELQQNVQAHLENVDNGLIPGGDRPAPVTTKSAAAAPVEIRSRGAFRFDFIENVATFQDQVDVARLGPSGTNEQMSCELLSVFFRKEKDSAPAESPANARLPSFAGGPKLEPQRVVAFGQPVVIRIPASEVLVRAGQVEYEIAGGATTLRDGQEVTLVQGKREIHCRELYAEPDESRQLGRFLAKGDGWLRGAMPDDPAQLFEARWTRRLHFRPHDKQHVLSLEGKAHVSVVNKGSVNADEIHLWLWEQRTPPPPGSSQGKEKVELLPDRLMSVGKVTFESPQMTGAVSQLQAWFEYKPGGLLSLVVPRHILAQLPAPTNRPTGPVGMPTMGAPRNSALPLGAPPVGVAIPAVPPPAAATAPAAVAQPSQPENVLAMPNLAGAQRMHIEGELLRILAKQRAKQMEISEVFVDHDVRIREISTPKPGEQPMLITGRQLHLVQQTANEAVLTVSGQPAHVEGRGMTLDSSAIHLNRLTNAIWTDGGGQMSLLVDRDPSGTLMKQPQRLDVTWQEKLEFNGRVARFRSGVVARQQQQLVKTNLLEVTFSAPINLNGANNGGVRPDVEQITCKQGVFLENPTFDLNRLVSLDRVQATELNLHRPSGQMTALGPGWVKSVRLNTGKPIIPGAPPVPQTQAAQPAPGSDQLTFIGVDFQGTLSGNMGHHEMVFETAVRTMYGPVQHWEGTLNPDKQQEWSPQAMLMTSDRLSIVQTPGATPEARNYEMEATGATVVEGATYTARAQRITYSQAKALLVIEGSGRTDADLSYQAKPGGAMSKVNARKIMYWPDMQRVEVDDARFLDLNNLR